MGVTVDKEVSFLRLLPGIGAYLGNALQRLADGINTVGNHIGVSSSETMPPPPTIQQLTVKTNGTGLVHAVISDNNPISKNLNYFVEYDTDPAFGQPHVVHLGASRTMNPVQLPGNDDNGLPQVFHFRGYSQYPGSKPGPPINFGGGGAPTPVSPGGTQNLTLIPSTGSGTAQATGQQGGSGFGKVLNRPAPGPKRSGQ